MPFCSVVPTEWHHVVSYALGVPLHFAQQGVNAVLFCSPNRMASCCLACLQVFSYILHSREAVPLRSVAANRMASCCLACLQVFSYSREAVPLRSVAANRMASCCCAHTSRCSHTFCMMWESLPQAATTSSSTLA